MKAAWREDYGGPEVVSVREIDKPSPTEGQVLVRVKASSVNRADLDGLYPQWQFIRLFLGVRQPRERFRRLGVDVAGTVEAVGEGVTEFKPGDDVFSDLSAQDESPAGAFAEFVCAPTKAFAAMPAGLSHEEAATLPHSGVLAIRAFRPRGGRSVSAGDRVMIVGASCNVGPFAIQIAKSLGAEVTAVARGEKLDFVRSLGADYAIDYETTDYKRPTERYDWIVDVTAHDSIFQWRRALKPSGVYLTFGGPAQLMLVDALLGPFVSRLTGKKLGMAFVVPFKPDDVAELTRLAESGVLKPVIDRRFPLDDVADALRHVDQGRAHGKVLVIPGS
jgi:NADPH:quinone reductase-like Zn-dependent oxidoreductase